jgi:general stress protein 26
MARVRELIWTIRVGFLTTADHEGQFHARPVQTLHVDEEDALWFFTDRSSPKVGELQQDLRVSLGYADPGRNVYVAVRGVCAVMRDVEKAKQIWSVEQRAYYPDGPEDGRLALLRVQIEHAEYWIAPGRVSYLVAAAKAAFTGTPIQTLGENHKVK